MGIKKLEAQYPLEVQPLATEINELLEHNEKIVERSKNSCWEFSTCF